MRSHIAAEGSRMDFKFLGKCFSALKGFMFLIEFDGKSENLLQGLD